MPIELVCFGFGVLGGLIGMLLFCLIWDDGFRRGAVVDLTKNSKMPGIRAALSRSSCCDTTASVPCSDCPRAPVSRT